MAIGCESDRHGRPYPAAGTATSTNPGRPVNGNGASPLRAALDALIAEQGGTLDGLTVLSPKRDPFRLDTPANHRLGQWLASALSTLGLGDRRKHPRGLHYILATANPRNRTACRTSMTTRRGCGCLRPW